MLLVGNLKTLWEMATNQQQSIDLSKMIRVCVCVWETFREKNKGQMQRKGDVEQRNHENKVMWKGRKK